MKMNWWQAGSFMSEQLNHQKDNNDYYKYEDADPDGGSTLLNCGHHAHSDGDCPHQFNQEIKPKIKIKTN